MDGDYQSDGTTRSVSVTDSLGEKVADSNDLAGMVFEDITYNGTGGAMVSDAITNPWISAATATDSNQPSPLPSLVAHMTGVAQARTYTALASGGTREHSTTYTHDSYGRITAASDVPDTSDPAQDTCTTTSFASNTASWILDLQAEQKVVSVPCGTTPSYPADAVSDTLTFYDNSTTLGAAPSAGDPTTVQKATPYNGSAPVYTTQSSATYDQYGRVLTATDADQRTSTTSYTPATGAEPTSVAATDPMGLTTTTAYDPARDLPTAVTDPAGYVTTETYDPLGRRTAVWKPGDPQCCSAANLKFSYTVSATPPSLFTTQTVNDTGAYTTSDEVAREVAPALGVRTVITTSELDFLHDVPPLLAKSQRNRHPGTLDLIELVEGHRGQSPTTPPLRLQDIAFLTYTSGTTGPAKGAMNCHRNVVFNAQAYRDWVGLGDGDVVLGVAPFFHITGLIAHLAVGLLVGMPI
ncbi:MAG: AMP-binding protein [Micromonosporaceae bacterium]